MMTGVSENEGDSAIAVNSPCLSETEGRSKQSKSVIERDAQVNGGTSSGVREEPDDNCQERDALIGGSDVKKSGAVGKKLFMPIIISKCDDSARVAGSNASSATGGNDSSVLKYNQQQLPLLRIENYDSTATSSLQNFGIVDDSNTSSNEGGSRENGSGHPSWNAFALSDPNAQITVKSITSVGMGSSDGRTLYVRRVPSSASILINNSYAVRRDKEEYEDSWSDSDSSTSSYEKGYRFRRKHWRNKSEYILACLGLTVGLANVWRFPYLCYNSGGGAFLIPYFVMLIVCAIPILFMELAIGQFTRRGPVVAFRKICPLLRGTGIASIVVSFIMSTYSIVISAWALYYLLSSFTSHLPWEGCGNDWNSENCWSPSKNGENASAGFFNRSNPTEEFFELRVLKLSSGLEEPGTLRGELVLCLLFVWMIVYFSLWKSVRSSAKVVYFTATCPFILLIVFAIFAVTLPGAEIGLQYFFSPRWDLLLDAHVWINAASQSFHSMGVAIGSMFTFSSYNKFSNNILTDTICFAFINVATSLLVGIAVFAHLGNIAAEQHAPISDVVADGPGLVFVVYPQAFAQMPVAHVWSILFFLTLLCVALDYQFAIVEVVTTAVRDAFPKFTEKYFKYHEVLVLVVCVVALCLGLPNLLQCGIYLFHLIDRYVAAFSLVYLAFFEIIAVVWIYGFDRLSLNVEEMTGKVPSRYFYFTLKYATPFTLVVIWLLSLLDYKKPTYDNNRVQYPVWAEYFGWLIALSSLICIPAFAVLQIKRSSGNTIYEKIKSSIKTEILSCPICKYSKSCMHEVDGDSEWNLSRRRSSVRTTKLTPVIMSETVFEKVSSL